MYTYADVSKAIHRYILYNMCTLPPPAKRAVCIDKFRHFRTISIGSSCFKFVFHILPCVMTNNGIDAPRIVVVLLCVHRNVHRSRKILFTHLLLNTYYYNIFDMRILLYSPFCWSESSR